MTLTHDSFRTFQFGLFPLTRHRERVEEVLESLWHVLGDVGGRRPVLEFQQHRGSVTVDQSFRKVLEALPELLQRGLRDDLPREAVDQIVLEMTEVPEECARVPQLPVQVTIGVGDENSLTPGPVILEQTGTRRRTKFTSEG